MSTKTRLGSSILYSLIPFLVAALVFGTFRVFFPQTLAALFGNRQLRAIEPSPTFTCEAHRGELVKVSFNIRNVTDEPLEVLGIKNTCSCTSSADTNFPIDLNPGAVSSIKINLKVGQPDSDGRFERVADLFVNRGGVVPSLVFNATVIDSALGSTLPQ